MTDIPVWTEREHQREIEIVRKDVSERCALLCEMMAGVYETHAVTLRKEGTYTARAVWPFGKLLTLVRPGYESSANIRDGVARTFRTTAACCRAGWDPRALRTDNNERLVIPGLTPNRSVVGVDGDPTTPYCTICGSHFPCEHDV